MPCHPQSALAGLNSRMRGLRLSGSVRRTEASMAGSRAASAREPGQIREEAALSDTARAPRISLAGADDRRARPRSSLEDGCTVHFSSSSRPNKRSRSSLDRRRIRVPRSASSATSGGTPFRRYIARTVRWRSPTRFADGRDHRRGSRRPRSFRCFLCLRPPRPCPPRSRRTGRELALVDQPLAGLELDLAGCLRARRACRARRTGDRLSGVHGPDPRIPTLRAVGPVGRSAA